MSRRGKKAFTIDWQRQGLNIKVPAKVHTPCGEFGEEEKIYFTATYKPADVNEKDTDAEKLREKVKAALDAWYSVTWELFMVITVEGGIDRVDHYDGNGIDTSVRVKFVAIGTHANGAKVTQNVPKPDKLPVEAGLPWDIELRQGDPREGVPETGTRVPEKMWSYQREKPPITTTMIPATQRNYNMIQVFIKRMKQLLDNLHVFLGPGQIENTLAQIGKLGNMLLPPGKKQVARK